MMEICQEPPTHSSPAPPTHGSSPHSVDEHAKDDVEVKENYGHHSAGRRDRREGDRAGGREAGQEGGRRGRREGGGAGGKEAGQEGGKQGRRDRSVTGETIGGIIVHSIPSFTNTSTAYQNPP